MAARSDTTPVPLHRTVDRNNGKADAKRDRKTIASLRPVPHRLRLKTVTASSRTLLEDLFRAAVGAAHPANSLHPHLPAPPSSGRLLILAAGKAAGSMAEVAERHYLDERGLPASRIGGLAVTRRGYGRPTRGGRPGEPHRWPRRPPSWLRPAHTGGSRRGSGPSRARHGRRRRDL